MNTRALVLYPEEYNPGKLLEMASRADELGYDSVWVGDSYFSKARLEALTTLAAVAVVTKNAKLGTATLISPLRDTVWLALQWATIDMLSKGRTILGLGVGGGSADAGGPSFTKEFVVAKVPYHERGRLLEEQIELLRLAWTNDLVNFKSEYFNLENVAIEPKPIQRPCPIWISNNPQIFDNIGTKAYERMMRRVGKMADGWMTCTANPEQYSRNWKQVQHFAREAGRDAEKISPAYQMIMNINEDRNEAVREATEFINRYYGTTDPLDKSFWKVDPFGRADECIKKIDALAKAGAKTFIIRFASPNQSAQLERFTKLILPSFR